MDGTISMARGRLMDFVTLTKPELTLLSVCTAVAACYMAMGEYHSVWLLLHVFIGTTSIGAGAGSLNQYVERDLDALMRRTENRPIPSGRLHPWMALAFGAALGGFGIAYLYVTTNLFACFLGVLTLSSYIFLYTPLKRVTPVSTLIGGIPGALPPLIGWVAVRQDIEVEGLILFGILFLWQMPHFYSLSFMYRKDYARAGFPLLAVLDESGTQVSRQILIYCALLLPLSSMLTFTHTSGFLYGTVALALGVSMLIPALHLHRVRSSGAARRVFFASLLYLPALLIIMALDKV